ncbi:hypothetical protein [Kibdelosporangium phytohabitans]|uniref:Uncharacterized protein n=1 Tax=Kibdelosporangium phytohabitans TaxID=860235 RepID=A0A0N9HPW6_9PSEU|nr:hypothetical protein [Kibdelosporangium phytohabitans]ALG09102.1 hypothetical protein AOZ06_21220 [Kibdelosporangium phytohabitans]MBE1469699.1 hypothetical protein [Kibdelosporangium phytohabitans]
MAANSKKNSKKAADKKAAEGLSFMKPIEARDEAEDAPKLSRAERRAAKPQVKTYGNVQNLRSQSVPNHRNFTSRRSGG